MTAKAELLEAEIVALRRACREVLNAFGEYEWKEFEAGGHFKSHWVPGASMIPTEVIDNLAKVLENRGEEGTLKRVKIRRPIRVRAREKRRG